MKQNETIHIAVAETSSMVRLGLVSILKHIPELHGVEIMEITSNEGLRHCMELHVLDVLIINPLFDGWFELDDFKTLDKFNHIKFISLICSVIDAGRLKGYDDSINLFDDIETISKKIISIINNGSENDNDQCSLSQREKEIVGCIVKGMTNKEIAEKLFISIHTVVTHRKNITRKLQIHSAAGLTIYAIVNKLVEIGEVKMEM